MIVGMVGSREYMNYIKIKEFLFKLKQEYKDDLVIVSGGCKKGADYLVKKITKWKLGIKYVEFPPFHEQWTMDCKDNGVPKYMYGKPYKTKYFFSRNIQIAKYCDILVAFIPNEVKANGTKHTIKEMEKLNKPVMIVN